MKMEIKTAKICWEVCSKCNRHIALTIEQKECFPNFYLVDLNKRYIRNINLYCCCDKIKYLIQGWQFTYGKYKEANKIYNTFRRYARKNSDGMDEIEFDKFKPNSKRIKQISEDIYIGEDFCPYYIEHQMSEWNKEK